VTATLSILFGGAMKESGKLLGFHVSLTIFFNTALSLAGRDGTGERRRK
jgi:hypothetical protein